MSYENKQLILRAVEEIINKGNLAFVDELISSDYVKHGIEGDVKGREVVKTFVSALRSAFPDLQVVVDPMIAEGDRVAWLRKSTGTHRKDFMGISATNQKKSWEAIHLTRIVDGLIVEEWGIWDFPQRYT